MSTTLPRIEQLGIEHLSVFGMAPDDLVNLTADLGCTHVAIVLKAGANKPDGHPPFSLRDDPALRQRMLAAMDDRGVRVSLGDAFLVQPDFDGSRIVADLDLMAELGAPRIATVSFDPERQRTIEHFGELAALAGERGMETVIEFVPGMTISTIDEAVAAIDQVGDPRFRMLVDVMHLARSGGGAPELLALDPALIGHVQLCDVPLVAPAGSVYFDEALFDRRVPGEGDLPLHDIVAALPVGVPIGLEVPMRAEVLAGVGPRERMTRCVAAARRLLEDVAAQRPA